MITPPYGIFLDGERKPSEITWVKYPEVNFDWTIVKNYSDFISAIIKNGLPSRISFESDLAFEHEIRYLLSKASGKYSYEGFKTLTGYSALKWLTNYCKTFKKALPIIFIHTQNEYAKSDMEDEIATFHASRYLDGLIKTPANTNPITMTNPVLKKTQKIVQGLRGDEASDLPTQPPTSISVPVNISHKQIGFHNRPKSIEVYVGQE
jgi:hypothetical protein